MLPLERIESRARLNKPLPFATKNEKSPLVDLLKLLSGSAFDRFLISRIASRAQNKRKQPFPPRPGHLRVQCNCSRVRSSPATRAFLPVRQSAARAARAVRAPQTRRIRRRVVRAPESRRIRRRVERLMPARRASCSRPAPAETTETAVQTTETAAETTETAVQTTRRSESARPAADKGSQELG